MATLQLLRLLCINPATSFGDDIRILVDGDEAGGEFGIDKNQTHDLSQFVFPDLDEDTASVTVFEDGDHVADLELSLDRAGKKRKEFPVKEGGFYTLGYRVTL
jgi:hypothetical protein